MSCGERRRPRKKSKANALETIFIHSLDDNRLATCLRQPASGELLVQQANFSGREGVVFDELLEFLTTKRRGARNSHSAGLDVGGHRSDRTRDQAMPHRTDHVQGDARGRIRRSDKEKDFFRITDD